MSKVLLIILIHTLLITGCTTSMKESADKISDTLSSTDVKLINYHIREYNKSIEQFTRRLYLKNPKYERDSEIRERKINYIIKSTNYVESYYSKKLSHEILTAAFDEQTEYRDRVYLLGLGLKQSIKEAYDLDDKLFITGLQVSLERLQRLYTNISQVNWRLKTYRDREGRLYFLSNESAQDGYINMGYEVIMTEILTRIKDDIYLRGGLPEKLIFKVSTLFLSIYN